MATTDVPEDFIMRSVDAVLMSRENNQDLDTVAIGLENQYLKIISPGYIPKPEEAGYIHLGEYLQERDISWRDYASILLDDDLERFEEIYPADIMGKRISEISLHVSLVLAAYMGAKDIFNDIRATLSLVKDEKRYLYQTGKILDIYVEELLGPCVGFTISSMMVVELELDDPGTRHLINDIYRLLRDIESINDDPDVDIDRWYAVNRHLFEYIPPLSKLYHLLKGWSRDDGFIDSDRIPNEYDHLTMKYINRLRVEVLCLKPIKH